MITFPKIMGGVTRGIRPPLATVRRPRWRRPSCNQYNRRFPAHQGPVRFCYSFPSYRLPRAWRSIRPGADDTPSDRCIVLDSLHLAPPDNGDLELKGTSLGRTVTLRAW